MARSQMDNKTFELGKQLVAELEKSEGSSTLCNWMAYYISDLMDKASTARDDDKSAIEKECFERITTLWQIHRSLPRSVIRTTKFDSIIETLDKISPKSEKLYFIADRIRGISTEEEGDEFEKLVSFILSIDNVTRRLMSYALNEAAKYAATETNSKLIEAAVGVHDDNYAELIISLSKPADQSDKELKYLEETKERIEQFRDLCDLFVEGLDKDIQEMRDE